MIRYTLSVMSKTFKKLGQIMYFDSKTKLCKLYANIGMILGITMAFV